MENKILSGDEKMLLEQIKEHLLKFDNLWFSQTSLEKEKRELIDLAITNKIKQIPEVDNIKNIQYEFNPDTNILEFSCFVYNNKDEQLNLKVNIPVYVLENILNKYYDIKELVAIE
ncbi:hypothetical protein [Francisella tularensis]|uniref:hypothetical protein n=1 Tax=Francisella tularensis TaxID=263 RepID=UPI000503E330|nr:hypothetical protein [Francisella tularensis]KFJ70859.1 hypothetical protein DR83_1935 [Francisella tularensis subsp. novicida]MBK2354202.1 hypothetical protein [Francisella tularensis subsp. novicida]MBK2359615.1 hypothetical protein [Francisella tularensis subsp. novicida]